MNPLATFASLAVLAAAALHAEPVPIENFPAALAQSIVRDLLAESTVQNGCLHDQPLRGGHPPKGLRYDGNGRLLNAGDQTGGEVFGTPWPLSKDFYFTVYDPAQRHYGIYLTDAFGNRDLIHHDPDIALRKPPAQPTPKAPGSHPLTFPRLVQPVLDRHCVECHEQTRADGTPGLRGDVFAQHGHSEAYRSLIPFAWSKSGGNHIGITRNKTSYSIPGDVGAHASPLWKTLNQGHHDVELDPEDMRRITLWLDANSLFYGDYFDPEAQATGHEPTPRLK
jgi:hypothetical protein